MKRFFKVTGLLLLVSVIGLAVYFFVTAERLKSKGERVMAGIEEWVAQKRDPTRIVTIVKDVPELMQAGDIKQGEALLDLALEKLARPEPSDAAKLPQEESSDDFGAEEEVQIAGYDGELMEPFISPDGKYLFFNNSNDPATNTNIHYASRRDALIFDYLGELPGVNGAALDAVASMDRNNVFYFTTLRDYETNLNSLYTGTFNGNGVLDVKPVKGRISPATPGHINMDVEISHDGNRMYISRAEFRDGLTVPAASDIILAHRGAEGFELVETDIFKNVNTAENEYAPAISADEKELFFTRAAGAYGLRVMVARRDSTDEPFGTAKLVKSVSGFVEAPTVSHDGKELFFHKKTRGKFRLFRTLRK